MDWRLLGFFVVFSTVGGLTIRTLARRAQATAAALAPRFASIAPKLVWAGGALVLGGMLSARVLPKGGLADALLLASAVGFGFMSLLLAGALLVDLAKLIDHAQRKVRSAPVADPARRELLLGWAHLGVAGISGALTAAGLPAALRVPEVRTVEVPIDGLPEELSGLRIAQISDVHVGPTIRGPWLAEVVARVNGLEPDLIAVTGDLVDGDAAALAADVAPLGELRATLGVFFCTGNHEYYSGVDAWIEAVEGLGMRALVNAHTVLNHRGHDILVAGVADYSAERMRPDHRSDPAAAIAGRATDGRLRLLLAHQPRSAFAASALDFFHLQLSGHTHGGQYAPFSFLIGLFQPFVHGLHRLGSMWIYTNRGTGYWGPPNRAGSPSEITLLRLVPAGGRP